MRPYFAILKDSFREAMASRVLWVSLILATIFLLALAPVSLNERRAAYIQTDHLNDPMGLAHEIVAGRDAGQPNPAKRVWDQLDTEAQDAIEEIDSDTETGTRQSRSETA